MQWYPVEPLEKESVGSNATLTNVNGEAYLVGGSSSSPYLQLSCMDVGDLKWKKLMVNSSGALNRTYHATAETGQGGKLTVFGGLATSTGALVEEVVEISTKTAFGVQMKTIARMDSGSGGGQGPIASMGLSAITIDAQKGLVIVFGGCNASKNSFSNEVWLYNASLAADAVAAAAAARKAASSSSVVGEGEGGEQQQAAEVPSCWQKIDIEGGDNKPAARAFHACCIGGDSSSPFIVIQGGQTAPPADGASTTPLLLNDVWMLTNIGELLAAFEAAATAESPSNTCKAPALKWTRLLEASEAVRPRYLHSMFCYKLRQEDDGAAAA